MTRPTDTLTIAMVGTRGVPAAYGGFETAVEEIGQRLASWGHHVRVYCRADGPDTYLGMTRVQLPAMRRRALETISHTALSVGHLVGRRTDVAFLFNAANAPLLPALRLRRIPVATHVDGLEWRRAKWSGVGQRYYRLAESLSVRWSDALIADARGIQDYYLREFSVPTTLIAYGAPKDPRVDPARLAELGVEADGYHLVVARFEPENHVLEIVDGYTRSRSQLPLVVVGGAPYSAAYTSAVERAAQKDPRIRLVGPVWDQQLLDCLYAFARSYVHGHSVGGTNPSLLRAIGAGTATIAYDIDFNREVVGSAGLYFRGPDQVALHVDALDGDPDQRESRAVGARARAEAYDWDDVARAYESLARDLAERRVPGPQRTRRASHTTQEAAAR